MWLLILIVAFVCYKTKMFQNLKQIYKILFLILVITSIILSLILPINKLENYQNVKMEDNKSISKIINLLEIKKESFIVKEKELIIDLKEEIPSYEIYKVLENKASVLFHLIDGVDKITFTYDNVSYSYYFDDINQIYKNIKEKSVKEINKRYETYPFTTEGIYMGNINGVYDIFDESVTCEETKFLIYEENDIKYYLACSEINSIHLYEGTLKLNLIDKFSDIKIDDLLKTNLKISKE